MNCKFRVDERTFELGRLYRLEPVLMYLFKLDAKDKKFIFKALTWEFSSLCMIDEHEKCYLYKEENFLRKEIYQEARSTWELSYVLRLEALEKYL